MSVVTGEYLTKIVSNGIINYVCEYKSEHIYTEESKTNLRGDLIEQTNYIIFNGVDITVYPMWLRCGKRH